MSANDDLAVLANLLASTRLTASERVAFAAMHRKAEGGGALLPAQQEMVDDAVARYAIGATVDQAPEARLLMPSGLKQPKPKMPPGRRAPRPRSAKPPHRIHR
jgi:hypothetical protein